MSTDQFNNISAYLLGYISNDLHALLKDQTGSYISDCIEITKGRDFPLNTDEIRQGIFDLLKGYRDNRLKEGNEFLFSDDLIISLKINQSHEEDYLLPDDYVVKAYIEALSVLSTTDKKLSKIVG